MAYMSKDLIKTLDFMNDFATALRKLRESASEETGQEFTYQECQAIIQAINLLHEGGRK